MTTRLRKGMAVPSFVSVAVAWLSPRLSAPESRTSSITSQHFVLICAAVFLLASGVRLLHREDRFTEIDRGTSLLTSLVEPYRQDARQMIEDGSFLFPKKGPDGEEERALLHPPGYAILLLVMYGAEKPDDSYSRLRLLHILSDALASVVVLLIAAELFPISTAVIGALLVALSPHLAYYSQYLSPESLAVLPILIAVYLIVKATKRPRAGLIALAGVMLGLSCWLRSNGLLLSPFLAAAIFLLFQRGKRLGYAALLTATTAVVISPITIRNWILSDRFIPLSLGAGITMMEGIGDYDKEGRFDMPALDADVARREAEWFGEPEYERNLWAPRGIERDRARLARALTVVRSNPSWFFGVMLRRAAFMVRYNQSNAGGWPFDTSQVSYVSGNAPFRHRLADTNDMRVVERASIAEWFGDEAVISPGAGALFAADGQTLHLSGESSAFADQLMSRPIVVDANSDYVLRIEFNLLQGDAAVKVTTIDMRETLNSAGLAAAAHEHRILEKHKRKVRADSEGKTDQSGMPPDASLSLPFASGSRDHVRVVVSNNGSPAPKLDLKRAIILTAGVTPRVWTRYPRLLIRSLQKSLFVTSGMLPLIGAGIILLAAARRWRALLVMLAVPAYYVSVHSAFHTEYRYILAMHYFLLAIAAVTLGGVGVAIKQVSILAVSRFRLSAHKVGL